MCICSVNTLHLLKVSEEDIRRIEIETSGQSTSPQWLQARRLHLTASFFSCIRHLKLSTPPDNLELTVLGVKCAALSYGRAMEASGLDEYVKYQQSHGHPHLIISITGDIISRNFFPCCNS